MEESQVKSPTNHEQLFAMGDESTWGERLLLNLMSYSLILIPIAVIIIATRFRLCPTPLQNFPLVQWFVYGRSGNAATPSSLSNSRLSRIDEEGEDDKFILVEKEQKKPDRSIHKLSNTVAFIWCLFGLQVSYLIWGYLQEKIMTTKYETSIKANPLFSRTDNKSSMDTIGSFSDKKQPAFITFHDSQFLVFMNRIVAFIVAIIGLLYTGHKRQKSSTYLATRRNQLLNSESSKPGAPLYEYVYSSLSNIMSSWCQYEALKYVNFPTQCLSKSCKVIPVMLMSKLLLHKKYQVSEYICAALLGLGLFIFLIYQPVGFNEHRENLDSVSSSTIPTSDSNNKTDPNYHQRFKDKFQQLSSHVSNNNTMYSGLFILMLYLIFDAFTSNWQQSLYTRYQITNWQMMAAINFYSILLTLTSLHQLGNLGPAFKLLGASNQLMRDCLLMSIMSSIGQMFVYYTIQRFGSVIFAVIMTLRQFFSILLSCLIYSHPLTLGSTGGLLLVFGVVGYQTWHKSQQPGYKPRLSHRNSSNIVNSGSKFISSMSMSTNFKSTV